MTILAQKPTPDKPNSKPKGKDIIALHEANIRRQKAARKLSEAPVREKRRMSQAYIDDCTNKRDSYAETKLEETGEAVREYEKIDTSAPDGGAAERKQRALDAAAKYHANQPDEKRFKTLQRNWANKQRKKGVAENEITEVLKSRQADFDQNGLPNRTSGYAKNKSYGVF